MNLNKFISTYMWWEKENAFMYNFFMKCKFKFTFWAPLVSKLARCLIQIIYTNTVIITSKLNQRNHN